MNLEKCDVFSLGITTLQLLNNCTYEEIENMNLPTSGEKLIKDQISKIKSEKLKNTLIGMLNFNPLERFDYMKTQFTLNYGIQNIP